MKNRARSLVRIGFLMLFLALLIPGAAQAAATEDTSAIQTTSKNDSDPDTAGKTAIAKTENVVPIENKELTASAENADADTANDSSDSRPSSLQD